ncbi:formin BNI1-like [Hibiscus syriacus]|uniref:Formin BNI1-like n=1 Tax=Hibiscus syriacus TaxID=106335 RepID=A0A6A3A8C5_HIBSY|nr:WD repeat-containing protein 75-like [Hibiscus syriacus]KAE8700133.1 formin BNI1-like [Hibiscus syriacus]
MMIRGGRSLVSSPPVFSNDANKLLVCTSNTVSVFSTATGLQISSLEGHTALVTSVLVVPPSSPAAKVLCYCWTASLDGTIRYWDFSVPELMKTIDIRVPIFSMVIPSFLDVPAEDKGKHRNLFAYVSTIDTKETQDKSKASRRQIRKCNLSKSCLVGRLILGETKKPEVLTVSPSGKFFGICNKCKLHIWKVPDQGSEHAAVRKITLHHTKKITVITFHPTQRIIASGDVTGRILTWRGFGNRAFSGDNGVDNQKLINVQEDKPGVRDIDDADLCSTWHWHSAEVNVLSFSLDGAYLYSGGKEGVLVVWQIDTGKKKFLPRIGSPLLYFIDSPDPTLSSISCADNQIHLLKMPSMGILKTISGIKAPCCYPEMYEGLGNGIAFDQTAGLVALRTENYCIQFYSLFDDRGISEVQVCERNHQPGDDVTVIVTAVALSVDGSLMSTSEVKLAEEGIGGLVCLKFWQAGSQNKEFSLSTIVYEPHRDASISAVTFHPSGNMVVSSSFGGDFKVWRCNNDSLQSDQMRQTFSWTCHAVGSYKKKPMTAAAFSADGSVLAVAAETLITLWNPYKNVLLAVLGETLTPIVNLSFIGKSDNLVAASCGSNPQLSVWSMSKLSLSWSYKLRIEAVASAVDLSSFAALVLLPESSNETTFKGRDGVILLYNATDPVPTAVWSVRKAKGGALGFLQVNPSFVEEISIDGKTPEVLLAYMNGDHEYVVFDPFCKDAKEVNMSQKVSHSALEVKGLGGQYGYVSIYGELPEFDKKRPETPCVPSFPSERPWETIFSGSSHSLPPLTKLCSSFLESLLEKRTVTVE